MARFNSTWPPIIAIMAVVVAAGWNPRIALGQYVFVQDTDNSAQWIEDATWNFPGGGYPNAVDATVLINAPMTTSTTLPASGYAFTMPGTDSIVGQIKIDN